MKEEQKQALVKKLSRTFTEKGVTDLSGCGIDIISEDKDVAQAIATGLCGYETVMSRSELPQGVSPMSIAKPTAKQIMEKYSPAPIAKKEEALIVEEVEPTYVVEQTLIVEDAQSAYTTEESMVVEDVIPQLTGDYPDEIWVAEENKTVEETPIEQAVAVSEVPVEEPKKKKSKKEKKNKKK